MRRVLAPALVLVLAFAGCVTQPAATVEEASTMLPPLDDLVHELGEILDAKIPVAGGVELAGTIYLPDVEEGVKVPVIMDLGPYFGNLNPDTAQYSEKAPPNRLYHHFLQRGYAIALVSLRGTGQSGGCFMIGGPEERQDAVAAVEWLAAQPWSDGNVAMSGVSYDGTTPWEAYVENPPSLKAIIPVASISDFYRYSFFEGVAVGGGAAFNTYYKVLVDHNYGVGLGVPRVPEPGSVIAWAAAQPSNVCPQQVAVYTEPYKTWRDGVHGPFWDERDMSAMVANGTAAVFVVHGLKDFNVKADNIQTIWERLPEPKRMLLGQWAHNIPWSNSYDKSLSFAEYNATIDAFLDEHMRGDAQASRRAWPGPVIVGDSQGRWYNISAWPPVESAPRAYHMGAQGDLAEAPGEGKLTLRPEPQALAPASPPGPLADEGLVFVSDEFDGSTLFMGNPWIDLVVSVDRAEGHLSAYLYEVHKDGEWELVSMGFQNLATRTSRDQSESVPTGAPMEIRVLMEALAQAPKAGSKLGLVLSGSREATMTPGIPLTTYTIELGPGSALQMPVFSG